MQNNCYGNPFDHSCRFRNPRKPISSAAVILIFKNYTNFDSIFQKEIESKIENLVKVSSFPKTRLWNYFWGNLHLAKWSISSSGSSPYWLGGGCRHSRFPANHTGTSLRDRSLGWRAEIQQCTPTYRKIPEKQNKNEASRKTRNWIWRWMTRFLST